MSRRTRLTSASRSFSLRSVRSSWKIPIFSATPIAEFSTARGCCSRAVLQRPPLEAASPESKAPGTSDSVSRPDRPRFQSARRQASLFRRRPPQPRFWPAEQYWDDLYRPGIRWLLKSGRRLRCQLPVEQELDFLVQRGGEFYF